MLGTKGLHSEGCSGSKFGGMSGALLGKQLGIVMVVVCDTIENKRSILLSLKVIPAFCDTQ